MGPRLDNATNLYYQGIRDGDVETAIAKYTGSRYTQHTGGVKDGRDGFIEFFEDFVERNPKREIEIVRGFEDGQYVFVHARQSLNDGEFEYVTADVFDTDDDAKMIEHWDVIAELRSNPASDHSQIDGPTEPTDLDKTEENKARVQSFLDSVITGDAHGGLADHTAGELVVEHSAQFDDVRTRFNAMTYLEVHKLIGCGDFVVALSHVDMANTEFAVMDIFRVSRGHIVEHWDVVEAIGPRETWANSGKF